MRKTEPCKPYLCFNSTPYAVTCVIRVRSLITTSIPLAPSIRDDVRLRERGNVILCLQGKWLQEYRGSYLTAMFFSPHALSTMLG